MLRATVVVLVLVRSLAPEGEGASGASPARYRIAIKSLAGLWPARPGELPWPNQDFWDLVGGVVPLEQKLARVAERRRRLTLPAPPPRGGPVDLCFDETPLRDALVALGQAAGVAIVPDRALPRRVAATPITLYAEGVGLMDALDLILMQASAEGHVVFYCLEDESIRVACR